MYMNGIKYKLHQNDQCNLIKVKFIDIGSLASYSLCFYGKIINKKVILQLHIAIMPTWYKMGQN